jgi:adenosylmethionine-8-amino-7-oxononanoate aminotransferase
MYSHGITFGGHPVMSAIALKNLEIMKREQIVEHVQENEERFRSALAQLLDIDIVGDLRGAGFFYALELVRDREAATPLSDDECTRVLREFVSPQLVRRGLICRADDRADPIVQLSPPLVAGPTEFDEIVGILGDVFTDAAKLLASG